MVGVFSPKGWDLSAQGNALGSGARKDSSPKGWESVAVSQPFGLHGRTAG